MFRFPSPSLSWRWVGRSGKKKENDHMKGLGASESRAPKPVVSAPSTASAGKKKKPWIQLCVKTKFSFWQVETVKQDC